MRVRSDAMTATRRVWLLLMAAASTAALLVACGKSGDACVTGASCDAGAPEASADAPSDATAFPDVAFGDGGLADASGCTTLNIGILGNPGQNASSNFQQWLVDAGTSVTRIETQSTDPPITAATLAPFDVVILDWLARDYTAAEGTVVQNRIDAGGGLISMSGYDNTSNDFRADVLLAPLGVAYVPPLVSLSCSVPVTNFAVHPITQGLTDVTFCGGYDVADIGGSPSVRTPIAFYPGADGGLSPVGYAIQMGGGRAFVWGDEWIEFDSEWSSNAQIKQLWVNIFKWVAPQGCALQPN